jgi:hypothetical protein
VIYVCERVCVYARRMKCVCLIVSVTLCVFMWVCEYSACLYVMSVSESGSVGKS